MESPRTALLRCRHYSVLLAHNSSQFASTDKERRVYKNAERVRTCNSVATKIPGMFASVNNITDPSTGKVLGYISNAGIPSVAFITEQELDVITPYSVFPTILFHKGVGLTWWRDMVAGKKMQSMSI